MTTDLTLGGKVRPGPGVTAAKVEAMKDLIEGTIQGNRLKAGTLVEALTTSDAVFSLAHVVNVSFLPKYEEAERVWKQIAGTRGVSDFRDAVLYTLAQNWNDGVLGDGDPAHVAPVVPEAAPYPQAFIRGEQIEGARLRKRGFKTSFSWEALLGDVTGVLRDLPDEMLRVALATEEFEVLSTLVAALDGTNSLAGGTIPDGTVVPANSALSRSALIQAVTELKSRKRNGRSIKTGDSFTLLVPQGLGIYANFVLQNVSLERIEDSPLIFGVTGYNPLSGISVLETEFLSGTQWALIPKVGATDRPVLERLYLIGHETPELRVENAAGSYIGGATVDPYLGSYQNDTISLRIREVGDGVVWSKDYVIHSTGAGTPVGP